MLFQSHYGLILTKTGISARKTESKFQSHYGLILTLPSMASPTEPTIISIPLWSDFNPYGPSGIGKGLIISIPLWSDFNLHVSLAASRKEHISIPLWSDFNLKPCWANTMFRGKFQSHYGLILTTFTTSHFGQNGQISIPLWSDFNRLAASLFAMLRLYFNPIMVWF